MIFREDELISLNTPAKSTHNIFPHCHRDPVLTAEIRSSGHVADIRVIVKIGFCFICLVLFSVTASEKTSH